jgi:hypothetical protein
MKTYIIIELQCGCTISFIKYLREHRHIQGQSVMIWCVNCGEAFKPVDYRTEDLDNAY